MEECNKGYLKGLQVAFAVKLLAQANGVAQANDTDRQTLVLGRLLAEYRGVGRDRAGGLLG